MLFHDTYLARSFCLFSGSNALGWPVAVLPRLSGADFVCILDSYCLFTHHNHFTHFPTYPSPFSLLLARLAIVAGPAYLSTSPPFLPYSGPACHCGRSRPFNPSPPFTFSSSSLCPSATLRFHASYPLPFTHFASTFWPGLSLWQVPPPTFFLPHFHQLTPFTHPHRSLLISHRYSQTLTFSSLYLPPYYPT